MQPSKAWGPMVVSPLGSDRASIATHPEKAPSLIVVILDGSDENVIDLHPLKQFSGIAVLCIALVGNSVNVTCSQPSNVDPTL